MEEALGRDLRSYFLRKFYDDHVQRYQKRPIYWLLSVAMAASTPWSTCTATDPTQCRWCSTTTYGDSAQQAGGALAPPGAGEHQHSINAHRDKGAEALKEIDKLRKTILELTAYENDVLYPLATQQVEIDLDNGVKVNYNKLGKALRKD